MSQFPAQTQQPGQFNPAFQGQAPQQQQQVQHFSQQAAPPGAAFPTLAELMGDPEFASAYNTIGAKLYEAAAGRIPAFAGAARA